jgi:hypothetical protein
MLHAHEAEGAGRFAALVLAHHLSLHRRKADGGERNRTRINTLARAWTYRCSMGATDLSVDCSRLLPLEAALASPRVLVAVADFPLQTASDGQGARTSPWHPSARQSLELPLRGLADSFPKRFEDHHEG